ncbi:MAG: pyruvate ferredoxin oxidoreductase [Prevotella sp.]|nr:pyruvate ferredoxin oxidoreductase [Prevotella sp.]
MDYKYIEQLLDRYFEGETTLQEEQILKAFYAQGALTEMPEGLRRYAALFSVMAERPTLDSDFDDRMLQMIGEQQPEPATPQVKARTISLADRLRPLFGAAAVVAIMLTLAGAISQSFKHNDTWVDADEYAQRGVTVAPAEPAVAFEQPALTDSLVMAVDSIKLKIEN